MHGQQLLRAADTEKIQLAEECGVLDCGIYDTKNSVAIIIVLFENNVLQPVASRTQAI
jgi:hypothetical protein